MGNVKLGELLRQGQVILPSVYDCISARAAWLTGYPGMYLSRSVLAASLHGVEGEEYVSTEEILWMTARITAYSTLPLLAGIGNGGTRSAKAVGVMAERIFAQGADGILLDDWEGEWIEGESFLEKLQAVVQAAGPCRLVAVRTALKDLQKAAERCEKAHRARCCAGRPETGKKRLPGQDAGGKICRGKALVSFLSQTEAGTL